MDAFERLVYGRDERDVDDEASEDTDVADDELADEASSLSRDGSGPTKRRRWWCASAAGRGRARARSPGATACRRTR